MTWINHYLTAAYEDGARGPRKYDCWGLVREARHLHCGKALLPSWGEIRHTQPKEFTKACVAEAAQMEECLPEHGAIAAVFRGHICIHVALVVLYSDRLYGLEINPAKGARLQPLPDFERQYFKVVYYRDR